MPLKRSIVKGLSFGKSDRKPTDEPASATTTPYFQSAPNKGYDIKKAWFISGRQPSPHPILQPHQIRTLTTLLSLPRHTPLLSTRIAALGPPLARPHFTNPPTGFCESHLWFEGRWIEEFIGVIGEEIGPRLGRLRRWNKGEREGLVTSDMLSPETREVLMTLEPYLHLFPVPGAEAEASSDVSECHRDACSICSLANCPACKLSLFLQNEDAVRAVRICAFGRKKKREEWPEACAWLDPEPGSDWEARWRREGNEILRDRAMVQRSDKNARLSAGSGNSTVGSEYSRESTGAPSVASDRSSRGKKSSTAESLREAFLNDGETADGEKTWAEDFPVEEYTKDVNSCCTGLTRGTSTRPESLDNMEDADSRYSRSTRGTSVSRAPLCHTEDLKPQRFRSVRGTSTRRRSSANIQDAESRYSRSTRGTSVSIAPLCHREDLNPRRLRSVRGMSAPKGASAYNEAELTQNRSSKADYSTFLNKIASGRKGEENLDSGDEEDLEVKAAAWARSYEQLTRERARSEWFRPSQPSPDYDAVIKTPAFKQKVACDRYGGV